MRGGSLALGHSGRRRRHRQVPVTALLPAADGDAVPCHYRAQRTRRSCFEALLETAAVLVLAPLMPAIELDPDATDEARSLTVVIVCVLYSRNGLRIAGSAAKLLLLCSEPRSVDAAD